MPTTIPPLADFSLRLGCGLSTLLVMTPVRLVPPRFFQTQCQIVLGLLVLSALDTSRSGVRGPILWALVGSSALSYLGAVAWGMGVHRLGLPIAALIASACAAALIDASGFPDSEHWALSAAGRLSSAFLMGATLTAMLLGHHYITSPAMSIEPLKRFVRCVSAGLLVRAIIAGIGLWLWFSGRVGGAGSTGVSPLFLAMRWGMGVIGPAVAAALTWQTVRIRSTQSATGILYIAMTLVLFGELSAMILSRDSGVAF